MSKIVKDVAIQLRVSELEKIFLQIKAEKEKVSLTEYIMKRALPERITILKKYEEQLKEKRTKALEQLEENFIKEFTQQLSQELETTVNNL